MKSCLCFRVQNRENQTLDVRLVPVRVVFRASNPSTATRAHRALRSAWAVERDKRPFPDHPAYLVEPPLAFFFSENNEPKGQTVTAGFALDTLDGGNL